MKILYFYSAITLIFIAAACSSSVQSAKENSEGTDDQEIYVFDNISEFEDTTESASNNIILPQQDIADNSGNSFIVQVGAFTSEARAQRFITLHQHKIVYPMNISYSTQVNLHVVQLTPFITRKEAEVVRDELWKNEVFKDAFIITK